MERIIKAKELKPGDQFKMNKQRVFRTVGKIVPVTKETWEENSFKALEGKMLIILSDCRQIVIEPETEVKCLRHSRMAEQVDFIFFRMKDKSFREWKDFYEAYCFRSNMLIIKLSAIFQKEYLSLHHEQENSLRYISNHTHTELAFLSSICLTTTTVYHSNTTYHEKL